MHGVRMDVAGQPNFQPLSIHKKMPQLLSHQESAFEIEIELAEIE
jgi:hypothetical protein